MTAYSTGRNDVWMENGNRHHLFVGSDKAEYLAGRRHALAELRLDADTEWDGDNY